MVIVRFDLPEGERDEEMPAVPRVGDGVMLDGDDGDELEVKTVIWTPFDEYDAYVILREHA